jgi:hypothetical protein
MIPQNPIAVLVMATLVALVYGLILGIRALVRVIKERIK